MHHSFPGMGCTFPTVSLWFHRKEITGLPLHEQPWAWVFKPLDIFKTRYTSGHHCPQKFPYGDLHLQRFPQKLPYYALPIDTHSKTPPPMGGAANQYLESELHPPHQREQLYDVLHYLHIELYGPLRLLKCLEEREVTAAALLCMQEQPLLATVCASQQRTAWYPMIWPIKLQKQDTQFSFSLILVEKSCVSFFCTYAEKAYGHATAPWDKWSYQQVKNC